MMPHRPKQSLKPGFHSNAIACVGKQPIMVATASTEHSYWLALAFVACLPTQAIAFEWKAGLTVLLYFTYRGVLGVQFKFNPHFSTRKVLSAHYSQWIRF